MGGDHLEDVILNGS